MERAIRRDPAGAFRDRKKASVQGEEVRGRQGTHPHKAVSSWEGIAFSSYGMGSSWRL